jgi:hypothetical protein
LGTLAIPHSLALDASRNVLYIADRQNGRVQMMAVNNGSFLSQVHHPSFGDTIYALSYSQPADTVYAVNGPGIDATSSYELRVFAINPATGKLLYSWGPTSVALVDPHALAVGKDGRFVYVGELSGRLWKFNNSMAVSKMSQSRQGNNGASKPGVAGDRIVTIIKTESTAQLILIVSAAIAIPLLLIVLVCLCIRFRKQGGFRRMNMSSLQSAYRNGGSGGGGSGSHKENGRVPLLNGMAWSRSHKGFQPLNTEDIDAVDDITDESDNEDTIYPVRNNHSTDPMRA